MLRVDAERAPPARCVDDPHASGATGNRDCILFRVDVSRSSSTLERAARNREDTHPVCAGEAPAGAGQRTEGPMSSGSDKQGCDQTNLVSLYALRALPVE